MVATASKEMQAIRRQLRDTRGEKAGHLAIVHREIMRKHRAARAQKDVRRKLDNLFRARAWRKKRWIRTHAVPKKLKANAAPSKLAEAASANPAKAASAKPASEPEKPAKAASAKPASEPEKLAKAASTKPLKKQILTATDFGDGAKNPLMPKFVKQRARVLNQLLEECKESPWQDKFGKDVAEFEPWWPHFVEWYAKGDGICGGVQHRKTGQEFAIMINEVRSAMATNGVQAFVCFVRKRFKTFEKYKPPHYVDVPQ